MMFNTNVYPLLGLIQGLSQAAQPSPYPMGFGATLGMGASGAMQGLGQKMQADYMGEQLAGRKADRKAQREQQNVTRQLFGMPPLPEEEQSQPFDFGGGLISQWLFGDGEKESLASGPGSTGPQPTSQLASTGQGAASTGAPFGVPAMGGGSPMAGVAEKYGLTPEQLYMVATGAPGMLELMAPERQDLPAGMWYDEQGNPAPIPGYEDMRTRIAQAGRSVSNTTVNLPAGETEFWKQLGKSDAERVTNAQESSLAAGGTLRSLAQMEAILDQGVRTGSFAEFERDIGMMIEALGGDPTSVGLQDPAALGYVASLTMDQIMKRIQGTKGSISEKEMSAFAEASAGLGQTPEGNRLIIAGLRDILNREIEYARQLNDWVSEYGPPSRKNAEGKTFNQAWAEFESENPLISPEVQQAIESFAPAPQTTQPVAPSTQPYTQENAPTMKPGDADAYYALPPGSFYYDPYGNLKQKPAQ